jgi:pseudomonalisin
MHARLVRRTRWSVGVTLAALCCGAAASPALAAPAGTSAWHVTGATRQGAYHARTMTVQFALAWRDAAGLKALLARPHAPLTPAQFTRRFSPSTATVATIRRWARRSHLRVRSVSPNRALVTITGSSADVAHALHTGFATFHSSADGSFFALTGPAVVPRSFAGAVTSVLGLSSLGRVAVPHPATRAQFPVKAGQPLTLPMVKTHGRARGLLSGPIPILGSLGKQAANSTSPLPSSLDYPASYTPQDFWSMYDAPSGETGSGQQLAIITEGDVSQPKADLATFEKDYGLPTVTWNQINVGSPSTDTSGDDEWDLDSQYSTGFAPGVTQLDDYNGPSLSDSDILATITKWVTDDIARQGSFSAGECDLLAYAAGFSPGLDTELQQADAQGQTMFFSSGDTGSFCPAIVGVNGVPAGIPDTNYPASSPYGIGVGGTSVLSPSGPSEIAWYAGGGGLSPLEPAATFQSGTPAYGVGALPARGVPDVSLDADPESGYDVVVGGTVQTIGGTSASAPSWQGIWARVQGDHSGALGFAGPVLYSSAESAAFHDIILGANGLYPAGPGYDLVTGLGTPDIAKLVAGA